VQKWYQFWATLYMRSNIGPASTDRAGPDATPLWLGMGAEKKCQIFSSVYRCRNRCCRGQVNNERLLGISHVVASAVIKSASSQSHVDIILLRCDSLIGVSTCFVAVIHVIAANGSGFC